jgi:hypothetical protein
MLSVSSIIFLWLLITSFRYALARVSCPFYAFNIMMRLSSVFSNLPPPSLERAVYS